MGVGKNGWECRRSNKSNESNFRDVIMLEEATKSHSAVVGVLILSNMDTRSLRNARANATNLFEMDGVKIGVAKEAIRLASHKLGIKTKFISKD